MSRQGHSDPSLQKHGSKHYILLQKDGVQKLHNFRLTDKPRRSAFVAEPTDVNKRDYLASRIAEFMSVNPSSSEPDNQANCSSKANRNSDLDLMERQAAARAAVSASTRTGDTLPKRVYELAGVKVPENATDELQRKRSFIDRILGRSA